MRAAVSPWRCPNGACRDRIAFSMLAAALTTCCWPQNDQHSVTVCAELHYPRISSARTFMSATCVGSAGTLLNELSARMRNSRLVRRHVSSPVVGARGAAASAGRGIRRAQAQHASDGRWRRKKTHRCAQLWAMRKKTKPSSRFMRVNARRRFQKKLRLQADTADRHDGRTQRTSDHGGRQGGALRRLRPLAAARVALLLLLWGDLLQSCSLHCSSAPASLRACGRSSS